MTRPRSAWPTLLAAFAVLASGCEAADPAPATNVPQPLGLMSSLPLYWPIEAEFEDLASGNFETPWGRRALEQRFALNPLDTLSPIPALSSQEPDADPLAGLSRILIVQPRGLSPSDNVALDDWVREGGQLFIALDPALSGHYDVSIGSPRRPSVTALIPPVVERWGLTIRFDEEQSADLDYAALPGGDLPLHLSGEIAPVEGVQSVCAIHPSQAIAQCVVGKGRVTVLADAAVFEHEELAGEEGETLAALMAYAFPERAT